ARSRRAGHSARAVAPQRRLRRRDRALTPAHRAGLLGVERSTAARGAPLDLLEHAQQLTDPADQQPLLIDLDPRARRGGEHDVIAGLTGISTPTWSHQSRPGPTASTIPCWGGGSSEPAGTRSPDRRTRSGSSSLITTRSKNGRSWLRITPFDDRSGGAGQAGGAHIG